MTCLAKQTGAVMTAMICGHVTLLKNETMISVILG